MRRFILPCFVVAMSLHASRVGAQSRADVDLAKRYYALGEELYRRSSYEGALTQFQQAYKVLPKPDLLYNIARCYEALGKPREAIEHYRLYLGKASPDHKDREIVQARLANLERKAKKEQVQEQARQAAIAKERQRREQLEREAKTARETREREIAQRRAESNEKTLAIAGYSTAGAGVAAVIVGAILGAMAKSKATGLEDANQKGAQYADVRNDTATGERLQTASIITLAAGGAVAIGGGVLLFLHYRKGSAEHSAARSEAPRFVVLPAVSPVGASLAATLRF